MVEPGSLAAKLLELLYYQKVINFYQIKKTRVKSLTLFEKEILAEVKYCLQSTQEEKLAETLRILGEGGFIELDSSDVAKLTDLGGKWGYNLCEWDMHLRTPLIKNLVNMFNPSGSDMKILDIGCGGGVSLINMAKEFPYVVHPVGLDISSEALRVGRCLSEWFSKNSNDEFHRGPVIKFIHGTALSMPFKDESFDAVFSKGLLYLVSRELILKEVYRVLKKEGRFIAILPSWRYFVLSVFRAIRNLNFLSSLKRLYPIINGLCLKWFNKQLNLKDNSIYAESRISLQRALKSEAFHIISCNYAQFPYGVAPLLVICKKT